jgi:hypothetical protein
MKLTDWVKGFLWTNCWLITGAVFFYMMSNHIYIMAIIALIALYCLAVFVASRECYQRRRDKAK